MEMVKHYLASQVKRKYKDWYFKIYFTTYRT